MKIKLKIGFILLGALLGFLYWYAVGCENGCAIQSEWYLMTPFGALLAYLLYDFIEGISNKLKK
ncbi:MAG: hypothetical protein ACWA41_10730 [Putridiphycobacter sp.]